MSTSLFAQSATELRELTGWLHDRWFELDDLRYDTERVECVVPLREALRRRSWFGWIAEVGSDRVDGTLTIRGVAAPRVRDDQGIGLYTIESMFLASDDQTLTLMSCQELRLDFDVLDRDVFEVHLEQDADPRIV